MTSSQIRDFEVLFSDCFTNGTDSYSRSVLVDGTVIWYQKNTDGSVSQLAAAPAGVSPCNSSVRDSEVFDLCDNLAGASTPFKRKFTWTGDHTATPVVTDFDLNGAAYVITGTVGICSTDAVIQPTFFATNATNTTPVTVPANVKSLSISNLGLNGLGMQFADIAITGGLTYTMKASLAEIEFSVQEDQDSFTNAAVVITPSAGHEAAVLWTV